MPDQETNNQELAKTEGQAPTKVGKTWFIKRGDGFIFACGEQEAWGLFHNRTEWMRRDFKIIGTSDGKTYVRVMKENENTKGNLEAEVRKLSAELTRYLKTYDKFKYDDLLEDDDPKVMKAKEITDKLQAELDEKNKELQNITKTIVEKAFNAELEVARGHIEYPTNQDIFTPNGNREKIMKNLT